MLFNKPKIMKKVIYALILSLVAVSGLVFANREIKNETSGGVIFKVQIAAVAKKLELTPSNFKGLKNVGVNTDNGTFYKYTYGETSDYTTAKRNLEEAKSKGFDGAYLIAFKDGKKISIQEALK